MSCRDDTLNNSVILIKLNNERNKLGLDTLLVEQKGGFKISVFKTLLLTSYVFTHFS